MVLWRVVGVCVLFFFGWVENVQVFHVKHLQTISYETFVNRG